MDIKRYRMAQNETQDMLAKMLGISRSTYTKYETGSSEPPIATIIALCKHWGISADELLGIPRNAEMESRDAAIQKMITAFTALNDEGKEKLLDYADDLVASGKYIKTGQPQMVSEA